MSSHDDTFVKSGNSPTESVPDFILQNHGSIFISTPLTPAAKTWVNEHIGSDNGFQPYWPSVVVETRFVWPILLGIQDADLVVSHD